MTDKFALMCGEKRSTDDTGEWAVVSSKNDRTVYISSTDFSFDTWMKVTGDFVDQDERIEYAQKICDRLNKTRNSELEN